MGQGTIAFAAPGPGHWSLDRSHFAGGTTTILQWLMSEAMPAGMERVFSEIGAPIRRIECEFVNGFMYTRVRPLVGGGRTTTRLPPPLVMKVVAHTHPEFRRRAKRAAAMLRDKPFLDVVRRWESEIKPRVRSQNESLQAVDLRSLDDRELESRVERLLAHCRANLELHFWLHGHDLGPIARLVYETDRWGLDPRHVTRALAGASPSTARPTEILVRLREIVDDADRQVITLDDVRACSNEAARLLDEYLDDRGSVLATGYDLTSFTLGELPAIVMTSIRTAHHPDNDDGSNVAGLLRAEVPDDDRGRFDEYLADARAVMDMRDDNGPLTAEWPIGLLRLTLLEAGRRSTERGAMIEADHALELTPGESRQLLTGELPSPGELETRQTERLHLAELEPPTTLGPREPAPPADVLPKPLPELVAMVQTALYHMGMDGATGRDPMVGVGVGSVSYAGRARTAASADEAIEKLEPGDVLVVRATSPAFNTVLTIAGAVVTANGGALSHAAVLARELGIPAIVGASGALSIPDGADVEVDPMAGRVIVRG